MRRKKKEKETWQDRVAQEFADWLSREYIDRMPSPGYYVRAGDAWRYLADETDATQDQRMADLKDDTLMAFGVQAEGEGPGQLSVQPCIVVLP